jgi:histidinol dehydrogenase
MPVPLWKTTDRGFRAAFARLRRRLTVDEGLQAAGQDGRDPLGAVRRIMADVRDRGDEAVLQYTTEFHGCTLSADQLKVRREEVEQAVSRCPAEMLESLRLAADRVRRFQEATLIKAPPPVQDGGRTLSIRYRPVDSAGVYAPGSAASLASSVLMTAIPARVSGVPRLVFATPPRPDGTVSDDRLVAAHLAEVDEIYKLGGAYAVAALAYGTRTVQPVDMIAGPGNIYGILAQKEAFGRVGVTILPGPSEVAIIADETANADWVAADLISQSEHNPGSSVLLTDSLELAEAVAAAAATRLRSLPRSDETAACLKDYGALIVAADLSECIALADELASEHVQIVTRDPTAVSDRLRHAGAVFVGPWSPVPLGDYIAGPSHVLPTGSCARFFSGLSANDFLRRSSVICYDRQALAADAEHVGRLARWEGLEGHALAVEARLQPTDG